MGEREKKKTVGWKDMAGSPNESGFVITGVCAHIDCIPRNVQGKYPIYLSDAYPSVWKYRKM